MSKVHSIGSGGCCCTYLAGSTVRNGEDNTVFISLIAHLKEPNKFAVTRVVDQERNQHRHPISQPGQEAQKGGSNLGAEGPAD